MANYTDGFVDVVNKGDYSGSAMTAENADLLKVAWLRTSASNDIDFRTLNPSDDPTPSHTAYTAYTNALAALAEATLARDTAKGNYDEAKRNYDAKARDDAKLQQANTLAQARASADPGYQYKADLIGVAASNSSTELAFFSSELDTATNSLATAETNVTSATTDVTTAYDALVKPEIKAASVVFPDYNTVLVRFTTPVAYTGGDITVTQGDVLTPESIEAVEPDLLKLVLPYQLVLPNKTVSTFTATLDIAEGAVRNTLGSVCNALTQGITSLPTWTMTKVGIKSPMTGDAPAWATNLFYNHSLGFARNLLPELGIVASNEVLLPTYCVLDAKGDDADSIIPGATKVAVGENGLCSVHIGGQVITDIKVIADNDITVGSGCSFVQTGATSPRLHVISAEECLPLGGGGGGTDIYIGQILGGNASPLLPPSKLTGIKGKENYTVPSTANKTEPDELGFVDADYPTNRPYAYPLPTLNKNNRLVESPRVNRWDRYTLPDTYKFGDSLPRLPDGLCYVRLVRPYTWSGKRWDACYTQPPEQNGAEIIFPSKARWDGTTLVIWWSSSSSRWILTNGMAKGLGLPVVPANIQYALEGLQDSTGKPVVVVTAAYASGKTTLVLSGVPTTSLIGQTLVVDDAILVTESLDELSVGGTLVIEGTADAATVVIACNRDGIQGFVQGDYVIMKDDSLTITDHANLAGISGSDDAYPQPSGETSLPTTSVAVLSIVSGTAGTLPVHTHTNNGGGLGGGGVANFSSLT